MGLLRALIDREGEALTRGELLEEVWGLRPDTKTRVVDSFIVRLRRYIEPDPARPPTHRLGAGPRLPPRALTARGFGLVSQGGGRATLPNVSEPLQHAREPALRDAPHASCPSRAGTTPARRRASAVRYVEQAIHSVPLAEIDSEDFIDYTVAPPDGPPRSAKHDSRIIDWPCTPSFSYGSGGFDRASSSSASASSRICAGGASADLDRRAGRRGSRIRSSVVLLGAYVADVVYSRPVARVGLRDVARNGSRELGVVTPSALRGAHRHRGCARPSASRRDGVEVDQPVGGAAALHQRRTESTAGRWRSIHKLTELLGIKRSTRSPCASDAAAFEQRISNLVAADPDLCEYVRQLKRREFAQ